MKICDNLKVIRAALAVATLFAASVSLSAQTQDSHPDIFERADMEADRLQRLLDLEDWQVFYVDSTLKHDYPQMVADYEKLRMSKVSNASMYQAIQDKWMDQIDNTYKKIFNSEQWAAYLKTGAGKMQKAREKRRLKAQEK